VIAVKPRSPRVLLVDVPAPETERIEALLGELGVPGLSIHGEWEGDQKPIVIGALRIDSAGQTAYLDGEELTLTAKEFSVLLFLARNSGSFFSRRDIMREVWKREDDRESRTVDVHIRRVRSALGSRGSAIQTKVHVGYRLVPGRLDGKRAGDSPDPTIPTEDSPNGPTQ
jgi:DNA-binding response OmpR family regulator